MLHPTTLARRDLKKNDREAYEKFREACRKRDNERNARKREMKKNNQISAEELQEENEARLKKNKRARERYQTASLSTATPPKPKCCCPGCIAGKKPREMSAKEKRQHESAMRLRLYHQRNPQKKTWDNKKRRERRAAMKTENLSSVEFENEHVLDPLEELGIDVIKTEDVDDEADETEVDRSDPIHRKVEMSTACISETKHRALAAIDAADGDLRSLSLDLWHHPELAFQEVHAHSVLTDFLEKRGFKVERHFKLDTAFRASVTSQGAGEGTPTIGVMCEYDALPGIGHACGHNLIAIMGLAMAVGLREALQTTGLQGKLVVLGTPAEEGGGGKVDLLNSGAYEGIDVAMMGHPSQWSLPRPVYVGMAKLKITFKGKASHASSFPWDGVNALDAAVACYQSISNLRQQMRPTWRVHGIFTKAGEQPNIIPEEAGLLYYVRAPTVNELETLKTKVTGCIEGAALATGCQAEYEFDPKSYLPLLSNDILSQLYVNNGQELGIQFESDPVKLMKQGGSTDMGNVSQVIPSVHPKYSINTEVAAHTHEFAQKTKTEESHNLTVMHAKALTLAAIDVFSQPELVQRMKEELKARLTSS